jgi:hypothetical protein
MNKETIDAIIIHSMTTSQNGRCSCSKRNHRERRLYMQDLYKGFVFGSAYSGESPETFGLFASGNSLPIKTSRI